jgi:hypothetical protein
MIEDLKARLETVQNQFSEATQQADFLRGKVDEAENLKQQLIGQAAVLRELIAAEESETEPELPTDPVD